jgi:hypothetical protein
MSRKPATARHRTDTGSAELIALLKASGVDYEPLGGAIDGVAWYRGHAILIDFKAGDKAPMTPRQTKLLGRLCPIFFVWSEEQVRLVVAWLKRRAAA